jgi:ribosomal protein S20
MKKFFILFPIFLILVACKSEKEYQVNEELKSELRTEAKAFMDSLKSVLVYKIQTEGIVSAVNVCSDTAQILTENYARAKDLSIKRVSFKNRNPKNVPDDYETKVLKKFEEIVASGKLTPEVEHIEVITENSTKKVRFLKPIVIQAECLNCHGQQAQILPEVRNVIVTKYPHDKAINYNLGDLRGAISIQKVIE